MIKQIMFMLSLSSLMMSPHISQANEKDFDGLVEKLSSFSIYRAEFVQTSRDDQGQALQSLKGQLIIERPNRFFWQANEPAAQLLVCDGMTIWHFDEDLEQVIVQKYAEQAGQSPLLLILDDAKSLQAEFDLIQFRQLDDQNSLYRLQAKDANAAVKDIQLTFTANKLASITFTDALQQATHINFNQIELNTSVDSNLFSFTIPKGVDVLYQ